MLKVMGHLSVRKTLLVLALGSTLAITIGSLIRPVQFVENPPTFFDKLLHAGAYFGLGMLWMLYARFSWLDQKVLPLKSLLGITLFVVGYGVLIEVLQGVTTTYRTADIWDILANSVGAIVALFLIGILWHKLEMLKSKF